MPAGLVSSLAEAVGRAGAVGDGPASAPPSAGIGLDEVLGKHLIRGLYQPIVEIDTGAVVGSEALGREAAGAAQGRRSR